VSRTTVIPAFSKPQLDIYLELINREVWIDFSREILDHNGDRFYT